MAQSNDWLTDTPTDPDKERAKKWLTQNPTPKPAYSGQGTYSPVPPPKPYYSGGGTYRPQPAPVPARPVYYAGVTNAWNGQPVQAPAPIQRQANISLTPYDNYYRGLYGQPQPGYSGQGTYQPGPGFTAVKPRTQQDFLRAEWNGYIKPRTQQDFRKADEQSWNDFQKYFADQQTTQTTGGGDGGYYDPYGGYGGGGWGGGGGGYETSQRWWLDPSVWRI